MCELELWRPVPGWESLYSASSLGRIRSERSGRIRIARVGGRQRGHAYRQLNLARDGVTATRPVHRLVCEAFHGAPSEGQEVRHLDGDSLNNCADNLAWGTKSENTVDQVDHGTHHEARKTHCPAGHRYSATSTYRWPARPSARLCRQCRVDTVARLRERRRAA